MTPKHKAEAPDTCTQHVSGAFLDRKRKNIWTLQPVLRATRPRVGMRRKGSQYLLKNLLPARSTDARTRRPQY